MFIVNKTWARIYNFSFCFYKIISKLLQFPFLKMNFSLKGLTFFKICGTNIVYFLNEELIRFWTASFRHNCVEKHWKALAFLRIFALLWRKFAYSKLLRIWNLKDCVQSVVSFLQAYCRMSKKKTAECAWYFGFQTYGFPVSKSIP